MLAPHIVLEFAENHAPSIGSDVWVWPRGVSIAVEYVQFTLLAQS